MINAGTKPTSERTEYLPPIFFLCSIKNKLNFFEIENNKLLFFSEIIIMFLAFCFIIFKANTLDKVSTVVPDFEIMINKTFDIFSFFFKFVSSFSSRSLKK